MTFAYDAPGRRISQTFRGKTTRRIWDGNVPVHESAVRRQRLAAALCAALGTRAGTPYTQLAALMIDPLTGTITTDDGLVLGPSTTETALATRLHGSLDFRGTNAGWSRYRVVPARSAVNHRWSLFLTFLNHQLKAVYLNVEQDGDATGWSGWTQAAELTRNAVHQRILKVDLGLPPYVFNWGEIRAGYDPRAASSSITVEYK